MSFDCEFRLRSSNNATKSTCILKNAGNCVLTSSPKGPKQKRDAQGDYVLYWHSILPNYPCSIVWSKLDVHEINLKFIFLRHIFNRTLQKLKKHVHQWNVMKITFERFKKNYTRRKYVDNIRLFFIFWILIKLSSSTLFR